ncbi:LPXTG cell wall anchor domain-containing protein [Gulosibacter chungangensis]|uniref:LPXTG cell wall anchor domain-containing protein n=1 Tax=Gulosibacter chungangensis TaxID=979746 RepID=A0A7J5BEM2_9MICO|nr:LPXTG cell wall anchor domain-containing protein [Gulosibacter chungangensis]KAB1644706.1 hypothetical protein F8O05_00020 [Gulosibacter chungangensis]
MPVTFRRWYRPFAAAAALVLASSIAIPATALAAEEEADSPTEAPSNTQDADTQGTEVPAEQDSESLDTDDASGTSETPNEKSLEDDTEDEAATIVPFVVGPEQVNPPYLYWDVRNSSGNALVGGATVTLQGPRQSNQNWGTEYEVVDNIGQPGYSGLDADPDPGEFLVSRSEVAAITGTNSRWRVQIASAPFGYSAASSGWNQMSSNNSWSNQTYDFGNLNLTFNGGTTGKYTPVCQPGYVYSIGGANGQIRQTVSGGSTTYTQIDLGDQNDYNALGIGADGSTIFAVERDGGGQNNAVRVIQYDPDTGTYVTGDWTSVQVNGASTGIIAGAVDLSTGNYLYGGYAAVTSGGGNNQTTTVYFRLWEFNPTTQQVTFKGQYNTGQNATGNGDMAFDAAGNLYVIWNQNNSSNVAIATVTAANLAAANGGNIPVSLGTTLSLSGDTPASVNGLAFDGDGTVYLGSGTTIYHYDPSTWQPVAPNTTTITGGGSTDLASCNSPATIQVLKDIDGGRVDVSDQFLMTLTTGSTTVGTATTTGDAPGVQEVGVGPFPAVAGHIYSFTEAMASGSASTLADYQTSWVCTDGSTNLSSGTGTSGSVTIPQVSGVAVVCTITNKPLVAHVVIDKTVLDVDGENPEPGVGWTVGAAATATTGSITVSPTGSTLTTNDSGEATWKIRFNNTGGSASVAISETQKPSYEFVSAQCVVTAPNGTTSTVELEDETGDTLTGITPGTRVECGFVNKLQSTSLQLIKDFNIQYGAEENTEDWTLTAKPSTGDTLEFESGETQEVAAGDYTIDEFFSGDDTAVAEGYELENIVCVLTVGTETTDLEIDENNVITLADGDNASCTLTNADKPGSVVWSKIDNGDPGALLAGSEWTLTGPGIEENSPALIIDCTEATCEVGAFKDQDAVAGQFNLTNLSWGTYTLTESKAPAGYALDATPIEFRVGAGEGLSLNWVIDPITNTSIDGPELPLTGGIGRDAFIIAGLVVLGLGAAAATFIQIRRRRGESA